VNSIAPKSPFSKGGLLKQFLVVPPFDKGGLGGIWVFGACVITEITFGIRFKTRPYGYSPFGLYRTGRTRTTVSSRAGLPPTWSEMFSWSKASEAPFR